VKSIQPQKIRSCLICEASSPEMTPCADGFVCESCAEITREGKDATSRALKLNKKVKQLERDLELGRVAEMELSDVQYAIEAGRLMIQETILEKPRTALVSGGEALNPKISGLSNTLAEPSVAAVDASNHRTDLLTMMGNEIAALALDAAQSINAENSLEKMLAHQMAAIHHASMHMVRRANLINDNDLAAKTFNAAMKGFSAYQGAVGALRQLRGNQHQHIVVQHVNVGAGGQALVGSVSTKGELS
jgi:hypothetical protein